MNKLFWIFLLDACNHAGIWHVNWPLVKFYIKAFTYDPKVFEGRILEMSLEKWFIPKFIQFQYGTLNMGSKTHASVVEILKKEGVWEGYVKGIVTLQDKDKDKGTDKATAKEGGVGETRQPLHRFQKPKALEVSAYARDIGFSLDGQHFCDFYEAKGWVVGRAPMKDWKAAVRTWKKNGYSQQVTTVSHPLKPYKFDVPRDEDLPTAEEVHEMVSSIGLKKISPVVPEESHG